MEVPRSYSEAIIQTLTKQKIMKTRIILIASFLIGSAGMWAQIKSDRPMDDFTGIRAGGAIHITIYPGETNSLHLEAGTQEEADAFKTEIKDGVLELKPAKKNGVTKIEVQIKTLKNIDLSGASDIATRGSFKSDAISIHCSGASKVNLAADTRKLQVDLSGAGRVRLSGTTDMMEATLSGASHMNALELTANNAEITGSGAAESKVNVKQNLKATVSGAGKVIYQQEPVTKTIETSGAGAILNANGKAGSDNGDTTRFTLGRSHFIITQDGHDSIEDKKQESKDDFKHWTGIEAGINALRTPMKDGMTLPKGQEYMQLNLNKSFSFALNLFEKDIPLHGEYVKLFTGLGFEFNHYALQNKVSLRTDSVYTTARSEPNISFTKNNLNENLLTAPLMLEFNTSNQADKSFHIAVGVLGGWKIGSRSRQDYKDSDGKNISRMSSNDYNMDPFRYSLSARIGYRRWSVFANYALSQFFKDGHGPELYPVSAGLAFHW